MMLPGCWGGVGGSNWGGCGSFGCSFESFDLLLGCWTLKSALRLRGLDMIWLTQTCQSLVEDIN